MKTLKNEQFPEIYWERGDLIESHDHENHYHASGESDSGEKYSGCWIEIDGEFSEITNINSI